MSRLNHYDCPEEHPLGRGRPWPGNHTKTCPVATGHDFGVRLSNCRMCAREYQSKTWVRPPDPIVRQPAPERRRKADHPHYDCDLPPEAHPVMRGVGRDHRTGCAVAEGHTPNVSTGRGKCRMCAMLNQRRTYRGSSLKRKYGMSLGEYSALLAEQNGKCAICHREQDFNLAVDHDHKTGKRRGLLCKLCNVGLGNLQDDPKIVLEALNYLTKWS